MNISCVSTPMLALYCFTTNRAVLIYMFASSLRGEGRDVRLPIIKLLHAFFLPFAYWFLLLFLAWFQPTICQIRSFQLKMFKLLWQGSELVLSEEGMGFEQLGLPNEQMCPF